MTQYTNARGVSLPMAVWLCHDSYDYNGDPTVISATTLLKPIRQIVLARKNKDLDKSIDIGDLLKSRVGTAVHDAIEEAWKNPNARKKALSMMGMDHLADRIKFNPDPSKLSPEDIPVYMEQREVREAGVGDYKISGKYDMILNGRVIDFKNTSIRSWSDPEKSKDYTLQGSIYRWLNPDKVTDPVMQINFNFTDWKPFGLKPEDPQFALSEKTFPLMTLEETDKWIKDKVSEIDFLVSQADHKIPQCTPAELWMKDPVFKVYKKFGDKTAMRGGANFSSSFEAESFKAQKGAEEVREIKSEAVACRYCAVRNVCSQADMMAAQGLLNEPVVDELSLIA